MPDSPGRRDLEYTTQILEAVIEASPLAMIALEPTGAVRLWSRGAERLFGWSEAEVLGKPLRTVPPEREEEFRELFASQLAGKAQQGAVTTRVRKDGVGMDVEVWTSP